MTDLLDRAVTRARGLAPDVQDEIARVVLALAGDEQSAVVLSDEERNSLQGSLDQAARGEFASDEQIRAIWAKHGL